MKQVAGVEEATPVLNWLVAKIRDESRAVNLWAVDYPASRPSPAASTSSRGGALEQPDDLVMDTVLAARHRHARGRHACPC